MSGDDRLAVLSAHKTRLAKRILDDFKPGGTVGIEDHFNDWVAKHVEDEGRNRIRPLTDIERRMLFFEVCYTSDLKVRVLPGRDGKPDRWMGAAEPCGTGQRVITPTEAS